MSDPVVTVSSTAFQASLDVRAIITRLRRRLLAVSASDDLSSGQASVLARLGRGDASTASALADAEHVRPQSMAVTLASLERAGLITRTPDPGDGRRQIVELTDAGRARFEGARAAREEWLSLALASRYTEEELHRIIEAMRLLERIAE